MKTFGLLSDVVTFRFSTVLNTLIKQTFPTGILTKTYLLFKVVEPYVITSYFLIRLTSSQDKQQRLLYGCEN